MVWVHNVEGIESVVNVVELEVTRVVLANIVIAGDEGVTNVIELWIERMLLMKRYHSRTAGFSCDFTDLPSEHEHIFLR